MIFKRVAPSSGLAELIECYWIVESHDPAPRQQKIIPDGFPEIIFHYGDPYRIKLGRRWEPQSKSLLAGQLSKFFFLENTGVSGIIGIKLKPAALTHLFDCTMHRYTDQVVDLHEAFGNRLQAMESELRSRKSHDAMIVILDRTFMELAEAAPVAATNIDKAIDLVFDSKGMIPVADLAAAIGVGERQVERLFKKYVGLSPKLYARVIRFNYIFQLIQEGNPVWTGIAYDSGFYDQSHFIRNFKAFTGEDPTAYIFGEKNMANFFLRKKE